MKLKTYSSMKSGISIRIPSLGIGIPTPLFASGSCTFGDGRYDHHGMSSAEKTESTFPVVGDSKVQLKTLEFSDFLGRDINKHFENLPTSFSKRYRFKLMAQFFNDFIDNLNFYESNSADANPHMPPTEYSIESNMFITTMVKRMVKMCTIPAKGYEWPVFVPPVLRAWEAKGKEKVREVAEVTSVTNVGSIDPSSALVNMPGPKAIEEAGILAARNILITMDTSLFKKLYAHAFYLRAQSIQTEPTVSAAPKVPTRNAGLDTLEVVMWLLDFFAPEPDRSVYPYTFIYADDGASASAKILHEEKNDVTMSEEY